MRTSAWRLYAIFGAVVLPAYFTLPRSSVLQGSVMTFITATSAVAIALGIRKHRPENPRIWLTLLGALVLYAVAVLIFYPYSVRRGRPLSFPNIADLLFLASYVGIIATLVGFGRVRRADSHRPDLGALFDTLIVTTGVAALAWVFVLQGTGHEFVSPAALAVSYGYPAMDVMMLGALIRLFYTVGRRGPAFFLMAAAVGSQLVADTAYLFAMLDGTYRFGAPLEAGWNALAILLALAALHPTMTELSARQSTEERDIGPLRLAMLSFAVLIPPAVIVYLNQQGREDDIIVIAVVAGVLSLLALGRVAHLTRVTTERRREQDLAQRQATLGRLLEIGAVAANESSSLEAALVSVTERLVDVLDWPVGHAFIVTGVVPSATATLVSEIHRPQPSAAPDLDRPWAVALGRLTLERLASGQARWIDSPELAAAGVGSGVAVPVTFSGQPVAVVEAFSGGRRPRDDGLLDVLSNVGSHLRRVVERGVAHAETVHHALHDDLTGLPNRRLFHDRLAHALVGSRRTGKPVALVLLVLDGFKEINDTLGHDTGDRLLVAAAARLRSCIRPTDTPARLGGDELAVVLPGADQSAAEVVAHRILDSVGEPLVVGDREVFPTASLGIAVGTGADEADQLLRNADAAMYSVKEDRRGGLEVYQPGMHARMHARMELTSALRAGHARGEFHLVYQPIVEAANGRIVGTEALLRWTRPDHGPVSPAEFIPVAEQSGLIRPLGLWVLETACAQLREWQREPGVSSSFSMSVNVSARQLRDDGFAADVRAAVTAAGISPAALTLEVTESALVRSVDHLVGQLHRLKEVGVRLAIDDFGTGYSSLTYLRRLPVDIVKIDRSFVTGVANASDEWSLALAIVRLIRALRLQTVAEGCESAAQLAHLRALRCDYVQGYYFARPQAADGVARMLADDVPLPLRLPATGSAVG